MSDYDAMLAVLEEKLAEAEAFVAAGGSFDPVIAAALAYAGASVAVEAANPGRDWMEATKAKNAAFDTLRDAVVATLGPQEDAHA